MNIAVRFSLICHLAVLLALTGCTMHKPSIAKPTQLDYEATSARDFVQAIAEKMPQWDADEKYAFYEQNELKQVKRDLIAAKEATSNVELLIRVSKLHEDWDALVALDDLLHIDRLA